MLQSDLKMLVTLSGSLLLPLNHCYDMRLLLKVEQLLHGHLHANGHTNIHTWIMLLMTWLSQYTSLTSLHVCLALIVVIQEDS